MGASNLSKIRFQENEISFLEAELFLNTPSLTDIDLSSNKIDKLKMFPFNFKNAEHFAS